MSGRAAAQRAPLCAARGRRIGVFPKRRAALNVWSAHVTLEFRRPFESETGSRPGPMDKNKVIESASKLICFAEDRDVAIRRMQRALGEYVVQGIRTNIPFHRAALAERSFISGEYDTRFVERLLASETGSHRLKKAIEETP